MEKDSSNDHYSWKLSSRLRQARARSYARKNGLMITLVLLSLLQFAPALASCPAPQFAPQSTFATGFNPRSVAVGDLNSDGALDLTVANNNDATVSVLLNECLSFDVDLMVSLGVDQTTVRQGSILTYFITVRNSGPREAINVLVNDTLASGTTFVRATATKGHFTAPPSGRTGTVSWFIGDSFPEDQEEAQIAVTVIVRGRTEITNTATVSSDSFDLNLANNTASITATVSPGKGGKK